MPKYFLIAGEPSGDMHAAKLIRELKKLDSNSEFIAFGGEIMKSEGAEIIFDYKKIAFMGFIEVFLNLPQILSAMRKCKIAIRQIRPDAVILIDYPGFNLKIAAFAKSIGLKVIYYISPQIWAWKENRVKKIKKHIDQMICILPFEADFYKKHQYTAYYYGHPLIDTIKEFRPDSQFAEKYKNRKVIAVLPGSRKQEVNRMFEVMTRVAEYFPEYHFILAIASNIDVSLIEKFQLSENISMESGKTYDIMKIADAGIIKSGTSALEAAIFNLPQVVCYKTSPITYRLARFFAKVSFISLVNLIANRKIVCELIQHEMNAENIKMELDKILTDDQYRQNMLNGCAEVITKLGDGTTSSRVAKRIEDFLKS